MENSSFWSFQNGLGENCRERSANVEEINSLAVKEIAVHEPMSQKAAEAFVRQLPPILNIKDGRIAEIPVNTIGKILRNKGFDISRIIRSLPEIYATSVLGWSETEIYKESHKKHLNIKEYRHYISKITDNNANKYYFRFTVHEVNMKHGKTGKCYIHSVIISNILAYKNGDGLDRFRENSPGVKDPSPFIDIKLQQFLGYVKGNE
jgi:hypothetical protein